MYFNFGIISFCNLTKDPSSLLVEKHGTVDLDGVSSQTVYIYPMSHTYPIPWIIKPVKKTTKR